MVTVIVRSSNSQDTRDRAFIPEGTAGEYLRQLQADGHCGWVEQYSAKRFFANGEDIGPSGLVPRDGVTLEVRLA